MLKGHPTDTLLALTHNLHMHPTNAPQLLHQPLLPLVWANSTPSANCSTPQRLVLYQPTQVNRPCHGCISHHRHAPAQATPHRSCHCFDHNAHLWAL